MRPVFTRWIGSLAAPGVGQAHQTGAGAEVGQVEAGRRIVAVGEVGLQAPAEGDRLEQLAQEGDGLGLAAGLVPPAEGLEGAGQAVARRRVVGQDGQGTAQRRDGRGGLVVEFQVPAASEAIVAGVAQGLGPGVQHGPAPVRFAGVGQGDDQRLTRGDVARGACEQARQGCDPGPAIGVVRTDLGGDPPEQGDLRIEVVGVGGDPASEGPAREVLGRIGHQRQGQRPEHVPARPRRHGVISGPPEFQGIQGPALDAEQLQSQPPGHGIGRPRRGRPPQGPLGLGGAAQHQQGAGLAQMSPGVGGVRPVQVLPGFEGRVPVAGEGRGLGPGPQPRGLLGPDHGPGQGRDRRRDARRDQDGPPADRPGTTRDGPERPGRRRMGGDRLRGSARHRISF